MKGKILSSMRFLTALLLLTLSCSLAAQVGVNQPNPEQALDVDGKVKISDDNTVPSDGTVRYNSSENSFEGFTAGQWESFNKSGTPTNVEYITAYSFNLTASGDWKILGEASAGGYVNENNLLSSAFAVPAGKVLLVDKITVTARDEVPDEFFYVGIVRTSSTPTSPSVSPSNPRLYVSGNSNTGPATLTANHMPLLRVNSGQYIGVNNSSNSQTAVRVVVYGVLVDDTDDFFGF